MNDGCNYRVLYGMLSDGPSKLSIAFSPQKHSFFVGDRIRITCSSDGNPRPTFQWMFNLTEIVNGEKYHLSDQDRTIEFNIGSTEDSGYYRCFASNSIKGKVYNIIDEKMLIVQERDINLSTARKSCSNIECSSIEKCTIKDNTAICSVDIWKIVTFVFLSFSLVLGTTFVILWRYLRPRNPTGTISDEIIIRLVK